jgi:hypothetical protein
MWKQPNLKAETVLQSLGDGENSGLPPFQIGDSEATYSRNTDSREYPAFASRPARSTFTTALGNINGLGQRNNQYLHVLTSNSWKYWNPATTAFVDITTGLSNAEGEIGEFNTGVAKYSILMNSTQKKIWDGTSTATELGTTDTPYTNMFAVLKGRIYALTGRLIKYCALNLPNNWSKANDSGSITITQALGDGTGICEFNDVIIVFTEHSMHELHGTGPSNYVLIDVEGGIGCISHKSIAKVNNRLYWAWYDGIYEYDGSSPRKVSHQMDHYFDNLNTAYKTSIATDGVGDFLYVSIPYVSGTGNNIVLKYDTRRNKWYPETGNIPYLQKIQNTLYGVDSTGQTWNMRSTAVTDAGTAISWEWISKPFNDGAIKQKKTVEDLYVVADLSTNSTSFTVSYSTHTSNNDSSSFTTLTSLSGSADAQNTRVQVPLTGLQNTNWYRLRLNGSGPAVVHYLEKDVSTKRR